MASLFLLFHILLQLSSAIMSEYRLPTTIHPIHYNITLKPNFSDFTFKGNEDISLNISVDHFNVTDTYFHDRFVVQMHIGPEMAVTNISLSIELVDSDEHWAIQSYDNETQIITFEFDITSGEIMDAITTNGGLYVLGLVHIAFNGLLLDDMKGFYISQYTYQNTTIYNAVTQFEDTDASINFVSSARRAFPCFDEPSFKAQFTIIMITPSICTVLSNMNVLQTVIMDDNNECEYTAPISMGGVSTQCKKVQFAETPPMSTYLVALVVGLYNNVTNYTVNGLKTSIYFPIDSDSNKAMYALNAAVKILPFYEELFGIPFPLPKMDCIALSDLSVQAMENWGLTTYHRTILLADPETSSEFELGRLVLLIAHEFAHQWFGNMVTMKWWDNLWLNEAFVQFVAYIATDYSAPELEIWNVFLRYMDSVLSTDSSYYIHSLQPMGNNQNEIDLFDVITYNKGMSIIRMLSQHMGSEIFMNGIQSYLTAHSYDNADAQQLWDVLGGDEIGTMMNSWVLQPGFPVLHVSVQWTNDYDVIFDIEQQRMMKRSEYNDDLWVIPLEVQSVHGIVALNDKVMSTRSMTLHIPRAQTIDGRQFYIFNKDMMRYYRVLYDEESFDFITDEWLNGNSLSEFDKFALISDQYALMKSNYIAATQYLDFLWEITETEAISPSYLLWKPIITSLINIDSLFCEKHSENNDVMTAFRFHALDIISPVWCAINKWNIDSSDSENTINLRSLLLYALVRFNDEETIEYGYNMLTILMIDDNIPVSDNGEIEGIDTDILSGVIECVLTHDANNGNGNILNVFISIYKDLNSEYQSYVLHAIGAVYTNNILSINALEFVLKSDSVTDEDKWRALYSLRRCYGRENVWRYLTENEYWESLFTNYAQDLTTIPNTFASRNYYDNVYNFFYTQNGQKISANEKSVNQTLENIEMNTEWITNNYDEIKAYLSKKDSKRNYVWIVVLIIVLGTALIGGIACLVSKCLSNKRILGTQLQRDGDSEEVLPLSKSVNSQNIS